MFTRLLDVAVLLLVAVAVLLPRPDVKVQPGLRLDRERRERVAELEAALLLSPGEANVALELAELYMDGRRPDWALAPLGAALSRSPLDHRLHARRSLALADHFEAGPAYQAAAQALRLCEAGSSVRCSETEQSRLRLVHDTLAAVKHIDMRQNPNAAKEHIVKALHPVFIPRPKAPAPKSDEAARDQHQRP